MFLNREDETGMCLYPRRLEEVREGAESMTMTYLSFGEIGNQLRRSSICDHAMVLCIREVLVETFRKARVFAWKWEWLEGQSLAGGSG